MKPAPPMTGDGWEEVFGANSHNQKGWLETLTIQTGGRFQWWRNVVVDNRYGGKTETGLPDYGVLFGGMTHWIECKHESDSASMRIGRLKADIGPDGRPLKVDKGVKPAQAEQMDRFLLAGPAVRCWVAARLEVSAATLRKASQVRLDGTGGDMPPVICRLIPWPAWRALMAAAEDCRRRGQEPQASIPAADLAAMGWPCRNAAELLAAMRGAP